MNRFFFWDDERVRFFCDAAEHSDFHRTLAKLLQPELKKTDHILDAGCGLGYLSTALLPYCNTVTAADCDQTAITALSERTRGLDRIEVRQIDVLQLREPFDVIVCCYFGSTEESVRLFEQTCSGKLIMIKRRKAERRFSKGQPPHERIASDAENVLESMGYAYRAFDASVPFDQPFRSAEDAFRFFERYRSGSAEPLTTDEIRKKLVAADDPEFPYRLPVMNDMRIFVVESNKQLRG